MAKRQTGSPWPNDKPADQCQATNRQTRGKPRGQAQPNFSPAKNNLFYRHYRLNQYFLRFYFLTRRYKMSSVTARTKNVPFGNFLIVSSLTVANCFTYSGPSGSGGAFGPVAASNFTPYGNVCASTDGLPSTFVNTQLLVGNTLRDMGKTVVINPANGVNAAPSTFRKVQLLAAGGTTSPAGVTGSNGGVTGVQGSPTGFGTFYIQVPGGQGFDSGNNANLARVVRML